MYQSPLSPLLPLLPLLPAPLCFSGFRSSFGEKKSFARLHEGCLRAQREQKEEEEAEEEQAAKEKQAVEDGNAGKQARAAQEGWAKEAMAKDERGGDEEGDGTDDTSRAPLFCAWTKRGFSIERSGDTIDVSA